MSSTPRQDDVLTVSQLTNQIKDVLEDTFFSVWVSGEISGLSRPQSGHVYLTLKDSAAQIRAAIWRSTVARTRFKIEDGLEVVCRGEIDVYPPRGSYQLIIREIQPKGEGALQLAFRQLQAKLAAEGLFDPAHKKPLPQFPRRIAFVTSPTGAAIRDFLEVLRRRWNGVDVMVIPARVQGDEAAHEIVRGIILANRLAAPPDVVVVGRGGGSPEDLWCFNDETVVRAIYNSKIPVVSAVGHEIDVTLSDLVADVRALTPSEAAERMTPSSDEIEIQLNQLGRRLRSSLQTKAAHARAQLDVLARSRALQRPREIVHLRAQEIDQLQMRMSRAIAQRQATSSETVTNLAARLESLSPLAVLARGYSLTQRIDDGALVTDSESVSVGDWVTTRLSKGQLVSRIVEKED